MNNPVRTWSLAALVCACGAALAQAPPEPAPAAQSKPAKPTAQSEAGEPRADTSAPAAPGPVPAASSAPVQAVPAPAGPAPATPGPATAGPPVSRPASAPASGQKTAPKIDRLELGTATVTGDREQPKVMYIVPWKRSDIGDLTGKPMNSLVDEILAPVDRDVFKREVLYYHAVQADTSQNGAPPKPGQQGEK
jgi:hypothetical protein